MRFFVFDFGRWTDQSFGVLTWMDPWHSCIFASSSGLTGARRVPATSEVSSISTSNRARTCNPGQTTLQLMSEKEAEDRKKIEVDSSKQTGGSGAG
eukprot:2663848-Rhodomonas_salina.5